MASPRSDQPLLSVESLHTTFHTDDGPVRALQDVSFDLDVGQTLGVVGESGSGKTVLSRSVMGLLPRRGVERTGRVSFEGRDLVGLRRGDLRPLWGEQIAMVFQDPMTSLSPVLRVGRQVTDAMRRHLGLSRKQAKEAALELLRSVGIPDPERNLRAYPHQLSGGMRQRVVIAIALSCSPKLLLADEPTTALDVTVQAQILDLLARQQRERRMAMILVSHDLDVVAGRTHDIAVMYAGRVVEKAPTRVLFANPRMPYTEALLAATPRHDDKPHARLRAIPGQPPNLLHQPAGCAFAPRCRYVTNRCRVERPSLVTDDDGHSYACWNPLGSSAAQSSVGGEARLAAECLGPAVGCGADAAAESRRRL